MLSQTVSGWYHSYDGNNLCTDNFLATGEVGAKSSSITIRPILYRIQYVYYPMIMIDSVAFAKAKSKDDE